MVESPIFVRTVLMDTRIENIDLLRSFILKLTDVDIYEVNSISLTSAQKSRIAAWCDENNIEVPDLSNNSFWQAGINSNINPYFFTSDKSKSNLLIGIDIQSVNEFLKDKTNFSKNDDDLLNIFTVREISYAESKDNPKETLTGIFAAKEAIYKAKNISIRNWNSIEIKYENDIPSFKNFSISISHSDNLAIAVAVIAKEDFNSTQENHKENNHKQSSFIRNFIYLVGTLGGIIYLISSLISYILY